MAKGRSRNRSNASHMRQTALNAFDLVEEDAGDIRAQRRMGRATLDTEGGPSSRDAFDDDNYNDNEVGSDRDYLNNEVRSEDDEEIDSDEAFGSDDDFDFGEFKKSGKSFKKMKKGKALDLNEDSESSENSEDEEESDASIDESQFVSLSEAWDMDEAEKNKGKTKAKAKGRDVPMDDGSMEDASQSEYSQSESEDYDEEDEDEDSGSNSDMDLDSDMLSLDSDVDDDEVDQERLSKLRSEISSAVSSKKSSAERKKKKLQVNNLAEGEFNVPTANKKVSFADLAASIGQKTAKESLVLLPELTKKTLKVSGGGNESTKTKSKLALDIPLARRIQDRYDRSAAYEVAKEEVDKWTETVKKNRSAEHLQFPINPEAPVVNQSVHAPIVPTTDMEKKVNEMLVESSLANEQQLTNYEDLAPTKLSMEEVRKRRNELRMMRELLFREEQKAKRIKKIKSKTYRKIRRKERERIKALVEDEEDDYEDKEGHDMQRARERMTLKHKTTGKWAKRMIEQGITKDKSTRSEMEEMLRQGESLRRKIMGDERDNSGSDSDVDDNSMASGSEEDEDEIYSDPEEADQVKKKLEKGLLGMSFMKEAEEKRRQRNEQERELLRRVEAGEDDLLLGDDGNETGANETLNEGRRKFAPGTTASRESVQQVVDSVRKDLSEESTLSSRLKDKFQRAKDAVSGPKSRSRNGVQIEDEDEDEDEDHADISMDVATLGSSSEKLQQSEDANNNDEQEENPWFTVSKDKSASKKKSSKLTVSHANNSSSEKQQQAIRKQKQQSRKGHQESIDIDVNQTLKIVDPYGDDEEEDHEDAAQGDDAGVTVITKAKKLSFKQKELVKRAFAGDDVVEEFQEEKRQKIEDEGNKEIDVTLPGWGSWGGTGLTPKRKFVEKVQGVDVDKRKDSKLKNVIISEKVNKKNAKYNSSAVPFPFENREQYERSLRLPIGQEWSSKTTFQKLTKPKVIVKPGVVIDPLKAPFK